MPLIFRVLVRLSARNGDWLACWCISHRCRQGSVFCQRTCMHSQVVAVLRECDVDGLTEARVIQALDHCSSEFRVP
jgi:hypothetical protein